MRRALLPDPGVIASSLRVLDSCEVQRKYSCTMNCVLHITTDESLYNALVMAFFELQKVCSVERCRNVIIDSE